MRIDGPAIENQDGMGVLFVLDRTPKLADRPAPADDGKGTPALFEAERYVKPRTSRPAAPTARPVSNRQGVLVHPSAPAEARPLDEPAADVVDEQADLFGGQ